MAEGALGPAAVLLLVLVAYQTDLRTPRRETSLIFPCVASGAACGVSQLRHVLPLGIGPMA
jgi:hypothetical protein